VKQGPAPALAREAEALALLEGRGVAPALLAAGAGVLVSERLAGGPRPFARASARDLRALGALLCRVHGTRQGASGHLPAWPSAVRTLAGYRRRRLADALALAGERGEALAPALDRAPADPAPGRRPFRLLHGDPVAANLVWGPGGPRLVDWEFWRMGDPAEDLAYLAEVNDLPPPALAAVLEGYGEAAVGERVGGWRAVVALEAGAWYAIHGPQDEAERLLARAAALAAGRR